MLPDPAVVLLGGANPSSLLIVTREVRTFVGSIPSDGTSCNSRAHWMNEAWGREGESPVPTIDIAPFTGGGAAERTEVTEAVRSACEEIGFFTGTVLVRREGARSEASLRGQRGPARGGGARADPSRQDASARSSRAGTSCRRRYSPRPARSGAGQARRLGLAHLSPQRCSRSIVIGSGLELARRR